MLGSRRRKRCGASRSRLSEWVCGFLAACDAESFAKLLWSGADAVTEIPADRWSLEALYAEDPDAPGKMTTRHGAFLEQVDRFRRRVLWYLAARGGEHGSAAAPDAGGQLGGTGECRPCALEACWQHEPVSILALQITTMAGRSSAHRDLIDAYFSTGNAYSVAAGRLSYFLGLHGPSIAVDTACSSSLVALHLACQGLRLGECDLALAGGVNLILTPELNINFSKARMMAPDGRCKTFDAAADGYVRGEGCAIVVLRRLADALADGDRILAVVRGSAVNQDGRSGGLTAPNGPAQEAVIRAALEVADIACQCRRLCGGARNRHAAGRSDRGRCARRCFRQMAAMSASRLRSDRSRPTSATSRRRPASPASSRSFSLCSAGKSRRICISNAGNPRIDWAGLPITVPTAVTPWPPIDGRRLAGVSSFGFSGTNAHVILEEAPAFEAGCRRRSRIAHCTCSRCRRAAS